MEPTVRHFAKKVLLIHLALLLALLVLVLLAIREVYGSAREHALEQAERRQSMLSEQTAHGVQAYYESILSDLELMRPVDPDDPDTEYVATRPPEAQSANGGVIRATGPLMGALLGRQLEGRLSHLFSVDQESLRVRWVGIGRQETSPSVADVIGRAGTWLGGLRNRK